MDIGEVNLTDQERLAWLVTEAGREPYSSYYALWHWGVVSKEIYEKATQNIIAGYVRKKLSGEGIAPWLEKWMEEYDQSTNTQSIKHPWNF